MPPLIWLPLPSFSDILEASRETLATWGKRTCPRFETASVGFKPRTSRLRDLRSYPLRPTTHSATAPHNPLGHRAPQPTQPPCPTTHSATVPHNPLSHRPHNPLSHWAPQPTQPPCPTTHSATGPHNPLSHRAPLSHQAPQPTQSPRPTTHPATAPHNSLYEEQVPITF